MTDSAPSRQTVTNAILGRLPYLTLLGCAGITANTLLSFEEPHRGMLLISALLLASAPAGLALHLVFTDELTPDDRRNWVAGLMSRAGPSLFGAYFTPASRRRATKGLAARVHAELRKQP